MSSNLLVIIAIVRDHMGSLTLIRTEAIHRSEPLLAEAETALLATSITRLIGAKFVILKGDSKIVLDNLLTSSSS